METVIKQAVGIDCGSQELVVTLGQLSITQGFTCKSSQRFTNNEGGFKKLQKWVLDELVPDSPILSFSAECPNKKEVLHIVFPSPQSVQNKKKFSASSPEVRGDVACSTARVLA